MTTTNPTDTIRALFEQLSASTSEYVTGDPIEAKYRRQNARGRYLCTVPPDVDPNPILSGLADALRLGASRSCKKHRKPRAVAINALNGKIMLIPHSSVTRSRRGMDTLDTLVRTFQRPLTW